MPGLFLFRSNSLDRLVDKLLESLPPRGRHDHADPLAPIPIVVRSPGMREWLRDSLAERLGIAANLVFPRPLGVVDRVLGGKTARRGTDSFDPWFRENLTFALVDRLPALLAGARPELDPLRRGLGYGAPGHDPELVDSRLLSLASELAGVMDRIIAFRPEVAAEPAVRGAVLTGDLAWLRLVWESVAAHLEQPHRAHRLRELGRGRSEPAWAPPTLRFFGDSHMAPTVVFLLAALARRTRVELYVAAPSVVWIGDLVSGRVRPDRLRVPARDEVDQDLQDWLAEREDEGHPLLHSFGRLQRELQFCLAGSLDAPVQEQDEDPGFVDPAPVDRARELGFEPDPEHDPQPSALRRLQSDLLWSRSPVALARLREHRRLDPTDDSIQFHSCVGAMRQAEALRDALLRLLRRDPDLRARDIVVLCPDLDRFAPLVDAVFRGDDARQTLPLRVEGRSLRHANPIGDALLRLLDLVDSRLEAPAVLDLLSCGPVRRRHGLGPDDLEALETRVVDLNIRQGADAAHRVERDLPSDARNTWAHGLDRLLLGVVTGALPETLIPDPDSAVIAPFSSVEGSGAEVIGRFADFVRELLDAVDRLREPRPVEAWITALLDILPRFCHEAEEHLHAAVEVRRELAALADAAEFGGCGRALTLEALRGALARRLENRQAMTTGAADGVTLTNLPSRRGVPARVVALLGLDDDVFPMADRRPGFDLTLREARIGDRDPRDEDRGTLLDALVSVRDTFLIFYTGADPRTREERPPAVPVGELRDLIDATFRSPGEPAEPDSRGPDAGAGAAPEPPASARPRAGVRASEALTLRHPLQPFSPSLFTTGGRSRAFLAEDERISHDRALCEASVVLARARREPPGPETLQLFVPAPAQPPAPPHRVAVPELARALINPARALLTQTLRLEASPRLEAVPGREPVELDALEVWAIRARLLGALDDDAHFEATCRRLQAEGQLPHGTSGAMALQAVSTEALAARERVRALLARPVERRELRLELEGFELDDRLELFGDTLVDVRSGRSRHSHLLGPWLRVLAGACADPARAPRAVIINVWRDSGRPKMASRELRAPTGEAARERLAEALRLFRRARTEPLPLFPNASPLAAHTLSRRFRVDDFGPAERPRLPRGLPEAQKKALDTATRLAVWAWNTNFHSAGDGDALEVRRVFGIERPILTRRGQLSPIFARLALELWGPVFQATGGRR